MLSVMFSRFQPRLAGLLLAGAALFSACAPADATRQALFPGVSYAQRVEQGEAPQRIHVIAVDLEQRGIAFGVTPADPSGGMEHVARRTTAMLAESGAQVAVNASYFLPFKGGSKGGEDYYPHEGQPVNVSGSAISGGRQVSPVETEIDRRVEAIVCFGARRIEIVDGQVCPEGFKDGVAAGPRLLADGEKKTFEASSFSARHPRTAIGISGDRKTAWLVVADGRQSDAAGLSLAELAALFADLGASDALNLDGGGSSTLVAEGKGGKPVLLNTPVHTGIPGRERPVANHILLHARK